TGILKLSDMIITDDAKELTKYFDDAVSKGLEGIIAKDLNAPYTVGARKFAWIKLKRSYAGELSDTVDVVIVGYYFGKGMRTELGFGGVLTCVYDNEDGTFKSIARVGSGFTENQMKELKEMLDKIRVKSKPKEVDSIVEPDVWVKPTYVIEVMADEITESPMHTAGRVKGIGYALRFPRMLNYRFDRSPEEATTVREIIKMYKMQKRTEVEDSQS
ncbi:MAG: DNA ligase, partial [archaeon]